MPSSPRSGSWSGVENTEALLIGDIWIWRILSVAPTTAFSPFPLVRRVHLERVLRAESGPRPDGRNVRDSGRTRPPRSASCPPLPAVRPTAVIPLPEDLAFSRRL